MSSKASRFLQKLRPVKAVIRFLKRVSLPGFEGLSLYDVSRFFFIGISRGSLKVRTSSMAYSFFIALFPTLIFLFTLIPFIPIHGFQDMIFDTLRDVLPKNAFPVLKDTITEITHKHHTKWLSAGFIAALYFSTNGFTAMMSAFNRSIHVSEKRPAWKQRLVALLLVLIFTALLVAVIALMAWSTIAFHHMLHRGGLQRFFITVVRILLLAVLVMIVIGIYYRLGPARRMHRNFFSPGVYLATILIILTSVGFAYYVNRFGKYNTLYGSIGSVIVVLLWIYLNSLMLLIGFELDAGIATARHNKRSLLEQEEFERRKEEG